MINYIRNGLIIFILLVLFLYLFIGFGLFFSFERFLYHPDNDDFYGCEGFQNYSKKDFNGTRFYARERNDTGKVIVYYHGNGGSACDRAYLAWRFERQRTSLLFVEYAGYAQDPREPSKELLLQDARNMETYIQTREHFNETIVLGESLGTSIAAYHSYIGDVDKVILVAPFYSTVDLAKSRYLYPDSIIKIEDYTTNVWLQNFTGEITIVHGALDQNIPIENAKKLFYELKTPEKRFVTIEYSDHNSLFRYWMTYHAIADIVDREELPVMLSDRNRVEGTI